MFKIIKAFCIFSSLKLLGSISQVNSVDMNDCITIVNDQFNKRYMFCNDKETWYNAEHFCNKNNGKLLNIDSSTENNWIYTQRQKYNTESDVWVGLRTTNMIHWHWGDDKHGVMNWKPGTPDGFRLINCARLLPLSTYLNDMSCDIEYDFICECIIPTTLTTTPTTTVTTTLTTTLTTTNSTFIKNTQFTIDRSKSNIKNSMIINSINIVMILISSIFVIFFIGTIIKKYISHYNNKKYNNKKTQIEYIVNNNTQYPFIVENEIFSNNNKLIINNNYVTMQPNVPLVNNESLYEEPLIYSLNSNTDDNDSVYNNNHYSSQLNEPNPNYSSINIQNMFGYLDIE